MKLFILQSGLSQVLVIRAATVEAAADIAVERYNSSRTRLWLRQHARELQAEGPEGVVVNLSVNLSGLEPL